MTGAAAELGFAAEDAAGTLHASLAAEGWVVSSSQGPDSIEVRATPAGAASELRAVFEPLPERRLGAAVRLPRCRMELEWRGAAAAFEGVRERVRRALLRGGG
jgi:hypothetical protein